MLQQCFGVGSVDLTWTQTMTWLLDARCWRGDGRHNVEIPVEEVFLACAGQVGGFHFNTALGGPTETWQKMWTSKWLC